nr:MAG TPA: upper collar protein [Caudoviricetes sp.]
MKKITEKITETELAASINKRTFIDYSDRLRLLATSIFSWKNLEKHCGFGSERFIEQVLFDMGRGCFVKDPELGFMVLNVNPSDKLNVYNLPTKVNAWSFGYNKQFNLDDIVYIMNNTIEKPTVETISLFAYRLYDTERVTDTNLNAQRTPVLLECDKNTLLSLKNAYMKYEGNEPFIYGNKAYDLNNRITAVNTQAPFILDKLDIHKHQIWDDALTFLGIDNANTDKKERLITDEVESNNQLVNNYLNCFYKTRKLACDMINEKFDLDIEIELNKDIVNLVQSTYDEIFNNSDDFKGDDD